LINAKPGNHVRCLCGVHLVWQKIQCLPDSGLNQFCLHLPVTKNDYRNYFSAEVKDIGEIKNIKFKTILVFKVFNSNELGI
jgi:hypothetical protein